MRWFRSNVRSSAWFALVATVLQLALTFGHLHLRVNSAAQLAAMTLPDGSSSPTKPKPRIVDENCAVCTLIQMAGAAAPAAAASLPLPALFASAPLTTIVTHKLAASPPLHFQARGPPTA